jgi:hypothetical protein
MQPQDKLLPLYAHSGLHIGTITLDKALTTAAAGECSLSWKGQGRKARITAVKLSRRNLTYRPAQTLTLTDVENNAFAQPRKSEAGRQLILAESDSIRALDRATNKVEAWPDVYDDQNVVICAGKIHGASIMRPEHLAQL